MAEEAKLKVMKCDFKMHTSVKNKITQYLIVKKKQAYKREEIKTQTGCKKGGHNKYNLRQNSRKNPWPSCIFT